MTSFRFSSALQRRLFETLKPWGYVHSSHEVADNLYDRSTRTELHALALMVSRFRKDSFFSNNIFKKKGMIGFGVRSLVPSPRQLEVLKTLFDEGPQTAIELSDMLLEATDKESGSAIETHVNRLRQSLESSEAMIRIQSVYLEYGICEYHIVDASAYKA